MKSYVYIFKKTFTFTIATALVIAAVPVEGVHSAFLAPPDSSFFLADEFKIDADNWFKSVNINSSSREVKEKNKQEKQKLFRTLHKDFDYIVSIFSENDEYLSVLLPILYHDYDHDLELIKLLQAVYRRRRLAGKRAFYKNGLTIPRVVCMIGFGLGVPELINIAETSYDSDSRRTSRHAWFIKSILCPLLNAISYNDDEFFCDLYDERQKNSIPFNQQYCLDGSCRGVATVYDREHMFKKATKAISITHLVSYYEARDIIIRDEANGLGVSTLFIHDLIEEHVPCAEKAKFKIVGSDVRTNIYALYDGHNNSAYFNEKGDLLQVKIDGELFYIIEFRISEGIITHYLPPSTPESLKHDISLFGTLKEKLVQSGGLSRFAQFNAY